MFNSICTLLKNSHNYSTLVIKKRVQNLSHRPQFDTEYLFSSKNLKEIEENIFYRKGIGNITLIHELNDKLQTIAVEDDEFHNIQNRLYEEILKLPNRTHPDVLKYGTSNNPEVIKNIGKKKVFDHKPLEFEEITKRLNLIRTEHLGNFAGSKSYYILGELAELEQALIRYAIGTLLKHKFELLSVPDILPRHIIESCGLNTLGVRNQVFSLDPNLHQPNMCLSGTSEMSLAGYFMNRTLLEDELPIKICAVSRCYRAETSNLAEERGIYRVHDFTKVEMFVLSTPEQSNDILEQIRTIQEQHFTLLDIYSQVLDMPPHDLGAPAYRKYDIEAWFPGRGTFGEISSCSNCTDFQSRRLDIMYRTKSGDIRHVHTVNGTASALPRLLMALVETGQGDKGTIHIPEVLRKYMRGKNVIRKQNGIPHLKLIKNKK